MTSLISWEIWNKIEIIGKYWSLGFSKSESVLNYIWEYLILKNIPLSFPDTISYF